MPDISYTDNEKVSALVHDFYPPVARGYYGAQLPTSYRLQYSDNRWHRVYAICFGNSASLYVLVLGQRLFLDTNTEYQLAEGLPQWTAN